MWNRIMGVQHVQPVIAAHLGHLHRKGKRIIGILEQAIVIDHDGMKMNPLGVITAGETAAHN